MRITVSKEDVIPYIYFVCSLAQRGKMYGGLSGKSDYIGGIFDRWINIIPESVIFNKYFLPKISNNLEVISDYYEYNPRKSGIAPDVLGVKKGSLPIPFVEYNNQWQVLTGAPQIEVKSFKRGQYMVSLRNQGYDKQHLVMVETDLDSDYLLPFFEEYVTSESVYERLKMDDSVFIKDNSENDLSSITKIIRDNPNLGSLKLITVCLANDFMSYSNYCGGGESPQYIKEVRETRTPKSIESLADFSSLVTKNENNLFSWKSNILTNNDKHKLLNIYAENIDQVQVIKKSKSSLHIHTLAPAKLNDRILEQNKTYIVKFDILDRSSNKSTEYFMHKTIVDKIPSREEAMLESINNYIKEK